MLMVLLFVGDNNMDVMYFPFFVVKKVPLHALIGTLVKVGQTILLQ